MLEQQFNGFNELLIDRLEQSVARLNSQNNQEFHHLEIFTVYGDGERATTERIDAIDVDCLVSYSFLQNPREGKYSLRKCLTQFFRQKVRLNMKWAGQ